MIRKLGGRKAFISLLAMVAGVVIDLATERGLSTNLMYLMMGIIGTYSAANTLSKGKSPVDLSDLPAPLADLLKGVIPAPPSADKPEESENTKVEQVPVQVQEEKVDPVIQRLDIHENAINAVMDAVVDLQKQIGNISAAIPKQGG